MSDSLYVTLMSGTDVLGPLLRDMPQEWYDAWVTDNEKAKGWNAEFKKAYKVAKIATLALIYGLSPAGLVRQFAENGLTLSLDDARKIYSQFWASIKYASKLKEKLVKEFEKAYKAKRALISPFMFPLPTGKPKDALNRNVQSSISSFLRFLWRRLFPNHLGVTMVCVVHDELVVECKKELVEDFKKFFYEKLAELNTELNLKYPMAMGFAVGETFYEIH
jgi:DNA polymerase I-like protein with 3'-5' exonuclease and polymerase domains